MKENTRDKVTREARRLFSLKGFKNTSLAEIAGAAGIQKPSLYYFFTNKEVIYFTVLQDIIDEVTRVYKENKNKADRDNLKYIIEAGLKRGLKAGASLTDPIRPKTRPGKKEQVTVGESYRSMTEAMTEYLEKLKIKSPEFMTQVLIDCQQAYLIRNACQQKQPKVPEFSTELTDLITSRSKNN